MSKQTAMLIVGGIVAIVLLAAMVPQMALQ
jgi:hypothetical protein